MYTVAYKSDAAWNDTRWQRPEFDAMLLEARAELDQVRRKSIYTSMALMMRDEGGVIVPMFNDFIDASTKKLEGVLIDPAGAMSNGLIMNRTWLVS
jgi:peptide/nickel transport system substrate-binding protein